MTTISNLTVIYLGNRAEKNVKIAFKLHIRRLIFLNKSLRCGHKSLLMSQDQVSHGLQPCIFFAFGTDRFCEIDLVELASGQHYPFGLPATRAARDRAVSLPSRVHGSVEDQWFGPGGWYAKIAIRTATVFGAIVDGIGDCFRQSRGQ
jgi:hypothetical protein